MSFDYDNNVDGEWYRTIQREKEKESDKKTLNKGSRGATHPMDLRGKRVEVVGVCDWKGFLCRHVLLEVTRRLTLCCALYTPLPPPHATPPPAMQSRSYRSAPGTLVVLR